MMKIFAKHGTFEKVIIPCPKEAVGRIMQQLNEKEGGNWLWVDKLQPGEGIKFTDNMKYEGFFVGADRFTDNLIYLENTIK